MSQQKERVWLIAQCSLYTWRYHWWRIHNRSHACLQDCVKLSIKTGSPHRKSKRFRPHTNLSKKVAMPHQPSICFDRLIKQWRTKCKKARLSQALLQTLSLPKIASTSRFQAQDRFLLQEATSGGKVATMEKEKIARWSEKWSHLMIRALHQALWCWLARDIATNCQGHPVHRLSWARQQLSTKTCLERPISTPSHNIDRWTKLSRCQDTGQDRATLSRHSYLRTLLSKLVKNAAIVSWNYRVSSHINQWLSIPSRK